MSAGALGRSGATDAMPGGEVGVAADVLVEEDGEEDIVMRHGGIL